MKSIKNSKLSDVLTLGKLRPVFVGKKTNWIQVTQTTVNRSDSREPKAEVYACVSCGRYSYKFRFASRRCLVPNEAIKDM